MAILIPPTGDTRVIRRLPNFDKTSFGNWHFMASEAAERKCLCGTLISTFYDVEYSTLAEIDGKKICQSCWPFDYVKENRKRKEVNLMATAKKSKAPLKSNNTTGYNGVVKLANGKYVGQSFFGGKTNRTEVFGKAVEAAKAYDALVTKALEEGKLKRVSLNFPAK